MCCRARPGETESRRERARLLVARVDDEGVLNVAVIHARPQPADDRSVLDDGLVTRLGRGHELRDGLEILRETPRKVGVSGRGGRRVLALLDRRRLRDRSDAVRRRLRARRLGHSAGLPLRLLGLMLMLLLMVRVRLLLMLESVELSLSLEFAVGRVVAAERDVWHGRAHALHLLAPYVARVRVSWANDAGSVVGEHDRLERLSLERHDHRPRATVNLPPRLGDRLRRRKLIVRSEGKVERATRRLLRGQTVAVAVAVPAEVERRRCLWLLLEHEAGVGISRRGRRILELVVRKRERLLEVGSRLVDLLEERRVC